MTTTLRLKKELTRHLRAGHPWVWADALTLPQGEAAVKNGTVVDVLGEGGKFVARGLYEAGSPIAVRVFTLDEDEAVDARLVERRLGTALALRRRLLDLRATTAFRWVNGEGDRLPGLVVDVYAHVAVVRCDGFGVRAILPFAVAALLELGKPLGITHVLERSRGARGEVLAGNDKTLAAEVEVREHDVHLIVDVRSGQKTGTFLDQRENRRAIRPLIDGSIEVANLFSYTGGFSVHAALAGAKRVVSVDSAPAAMALARRNFTKNGIDASLHEFVVEDCFAWLARARREGRTFGLVVVDPPSFAPSEKVLQRALTAYRDLFCESLAVVAPGGILAAASCSSHVTEAAFIGTLRDAAATANRPLQIVEVRGQPADHPALPAFPEGRYLKFVLCVAP